MRAPACAPPMASAENGCGPPPPFSARQRGPAARLAGPQRARKLWAARGRRRRWRRWRADRRSCAPGCVARACSWPRMGRTPLRARAPPVRAHASPAPVYLLHGGAGWSILLHRQRALVCHAPRWPPWLTYLQKGHMCRQEEATCDLFFSGPTPGRPRATHTRPQQSGMRPGPHGGARCGRRGRGAGRGRAVRVGRVRLVRGAGGGAGGAPRARPAARLSAPCRAGQSHFLHAELGWPAGSSGGVNVGQCGGGGLVWPMALYEVAVRGCVGQWAVGSGQQHTHGVAHA